MDCGHLWWTVRGMELRYSLPRGFGAVPVFNDETALVQIDSHPISTLFADLLKKPQARLSFRNALHSVGTLPGNAPVDALISIGWSGRPIFCLKTYMANPGNQCALSAEGNSLQPRGVGINPAQPPSVGRSNWGQDEWVDCGTLGDVYAYHPKFAPSSKNILKLTPIDCWPALRPGLALIG